MSRLTFHRRFRSHIAWAALIGFAVTMTGGLVTRFSPIGWRFLPFGIEALGPLGNVIFNSFWIFVVLNVFCLWHKD
jgi:hypothetical protein